MSRLHPFEQYSVVDTRFQSVALCSCLHVINRTIVELVDLIRFSFLNVRVHTYAFIRTYGLLNRFEQEVDKCASVTVCANPAIASIMAILGELSRKKHVLIPS